MKKLQLLMLTMLAVGSVQVRSMDEYESNLNVAFDERDAGRGYESGSEDMKRIRNPRRQQVGLEQEGREYIHVKSKRANFRAYPKIK